MTTTTRRGRPPKEPTARQARLLDELAQVVEARTAAEVRAEADETRALGRAYQAGAPVRMLADVMGMTERAVRSRLRAADIGRRDTAAS